jgi:MoaA/NifB/PqqE/SkfB family radical SAM enzyme
MAKNSLIEVNPKTRIKGYEPKSLKIENYSDIELQVQRDVLADVMQLTAGQSCDQKETWTSKKILGIYLKSYQKMLRNEPLDKEEFVISGHEILEYPTIPVDAKSRYLVYRYRYNKFPENKINDTYPPCLQIEPTSVCNFRCIMCYQIDPSFNKKAHGFMGTMTFEVFKNIIDQAEGKIEAITFASRGEPLLNKKLPDMLKYTEGKFLGLKLNTNASLLNEKNTHMLLSSDIKNLVFSLDAADKESYEKIRVNGDFDQIKRNLEQFAEIREKHYGDKKIVCKISGVRINPSQSPDEISKVWGGFVDSVALVNYSPWEDTYNNEINELTAPCTDLWRRMFVWWDGTVNPCDIDYKSTLSKWNINDTGLSDIWNSDIYIKLRQKHLQQQRKSLEPCARCIST